MAKVEIKRGMRVRVVKNTHHATMAPVGATGFVSEVMYRFADGVAHGYMVHIDNYPYALFGFDPDDIEPILDECGNPAYQEA